MSDYLNWEDSDNDLRELLGGWTENEGEVSSDSWSEDNADTSAKRSKIEDGSSKTVFKCPLCDQRYKSVSGFRGHMIKKHDKTDIKAFDNKVSDDRTTDCETASTSTSRSSQSSDFKTVTEDAFTRLLYQGVKKVSENKHHHTKFSKSGPAIVAVSQQVLESDELLTEIEDLIKEHFLDIMSVYGGNMFFEIDQEKMWENSIS